MFVAKFVSKIGRFVSNSMTSESPKLHEGHDPKGDSLLLEYRHTLVNAIFGGEDVSVTVNELINLDIPFSSKYFALNVHYLVECNNQTVDDLKHIPIALNLIVKFARHLIKPPNQRSQQWRIISFSNVHVQSKIQPMKGFETILDQLGYTEVGDNGLSFPKGTEPDTSLVLNLIADIVLFKKEIRDYILGNHPHHNYIDPLVPETTRAVLFALHQLGPSQNGEDDEGQDVSLMQSEQFTNNNGLQVKSESMQQQSLSASGGIDQEVPSSDDQAKVLANMHITEVNPCDMDPVGQIAETAEASELYTSRENYSSPGSHSFPCTVCGDEAVNCCKECLYKALCDGCSESWHRHPQRQGHKVDKISAVSRLSMEKENDVKIDGAYGIMAQPGHTLLRGQRGVSTKEQQPKDDKALSNFTVAERFQNGAGVIHQTSDMRNNFLAQNSQILDFQNNNNHGQLHHHHHHQYQYQPQHMQQQSPHPMYYQTQLSSASHEDSSISPTYSNQQAFRPGPFVGQPYPQGVYSNHPSDISQLEAHHQLGAHSPMGTHDQFQYATINRHPPPQHYQQTIQAQAPVYMLNQVYDYQKRVPEPSGMVGSVAVLPYNMYSTPVSSYRTGEQHHPATLVRGQLSPDAKYQMGPVSLRKEAPASYSQGPHGYYDGQGLTPTPGLNSGSMSYQHRFEIPRYQMTPQVHMSEFIAGDNLKANMTQGLLQNVQNAPIQQFSEKSEPYMSELFNSPNPNTRRVSVTSSSLISSVSMPGSILVNQLKQEPDLRRRKDICIQNIKHLQEDIQALDQEINNKLTEQEESFCESDEFTEMNKRKAAMMKEKRALEAFHREMDQETAVVKSALRNSNILHDPHSDIHYSPELLGLSSSRSDVSTPITMVITQGRPISSVCQEPRKVVKTGLKTEEKIVNVDPDTLKSTTVMRTKNQASEGWSQNSPNPASKPCITQTITPRVPVESNSQDVMSQSRSKSAPVLPPRPKQFPSKETINLDQTFPAPHPDALITETRPQRWHCDHCTFINSATNHACAMCHRTSSNPIMVSQLSSPDEEESSKKDQIPGRTSICETSVCINENDRFIELLQQLKNDKISNTKELEEPVEEEEEEEEEVGLRIAGTQDQVYKEKVKAQAEFQQQQQQKQLQRQQQAAPPINERPSSSPSSHLGVGARLKQCEGRTYPGTPFQHSSSDFQTPPSRISPEPASLARETDGAQEESSLHDLMGKLSEYHKIESLQQDGAELIHLVKSADLEGYEVDAVQVAFDVCESLNIDPIKWLKLNWKNNVAKVADMATQIGKKEEQNNVGDLTQKEAESAYITCQGNMKEASLLCVNKRIQLYSYLNELGDSPREEILDVMLQSCGVQDAAEHMLVEAKLHPFVERIWLQKESNIDSRYSLQNMTGQDMCHSFSTSVIMHSDFQKVIKNSQIEKDRRIRMILVEGHMKSWGRAEMVINILEEEGLGDEVTLEDVVEAVRNCRDRYSALAYLQQECEICYTKFPMSRIRSLNVCQCKMCEDCLTMNFEVGIREKHVHHWTCPLCSRPDLNDVEAASDYLQFLSMLLQPLIEPQLQNVFETKVRDWHLQKDPSFRWCAHCAEGFLADNPRQLRMTCPNCGEQTCYKCKKPWEEQHEGVSCEVFAQWKIDNDPSNQSVGLAKHLDENGIDCPMCKMRFALAKGGCMHFKCPQCGHEFCSGCNEAYHHTGVCKRYKNCPNLGFHCHCPRDCFSNLRDYKVQQLQQLLKEHKVPFNVAMPADQAEKHCPVMELKEFDLGKRDERCGAVTEEGFAGLCMKHYMEYLTGIINQHRLDPVTLMTKEEMFQVLRKCDLPIPPPAPEETAAAYNQRLVVIIKEKVPLRKS